MPDAREQAQRPSAIISMPRPTMIRNDQKTIGTGGQSLRSTVSRPAERRVGSCFRISDEALGISTA